MGFPFSTKPIAYICLFAALIQTLFFWLESIVPPRSKDGSRCREGLVSVKLPNSQRLNMSETTKSSHISSIDIIFVHGLGSNPDTTWSAPNTIDQPLDRGQPYFQWHNEWVVDFLPHDIPPDLLPGLRFFFYNHDSYWIRDAVETRLWKLGEKMLSKISSNIRSTKEEQERRIIFVAHSYGGLVIKQVRKSTLALPDRNTSIQSRVNKLKALVRARLAGRYSGIADHTDGIIFLGTPHGGSNLAKYGRLLAKVMSVFGSNSLVLESLRDRAYGLKDLHSDFISTFGGRIHVVNFFEERKTCLLKFGLFRWEDYLVNEHSATFDSVGTENLGLRVDHSGLNKFGSRNTDYNEILSNIVLMIKTAIGFSRHSLRSRHNVVRLSTIQSYTERPILSSLLEEKLRDFHGDWNHPHSVALYGLGGTGKSQLVMNYVKHHREDYDPILWINAQNENTARDSYIAFAKELQLDFLIQKDAVSSLSKDKSIVKAVLEWLRDRDENDPPWLVVVDGADDLSWGVREIIPNGRRGSVIMTSRDKYSSVLLNKGGSRIHVDRMQKLEAMNLLLEGVQPLSEYARTCAEGIIERLDTLAFVIDFVRAHVALAGQGEQAFCIYYEDLNSHQHALLSDKSSVGLTYFGPTVMDVWDATIANIKKENEDSIELLAFIALFNHGNFQDDFFRMASLALGTVDSSQYLLPDWLTDLMTTHSEGTWDDFNFRQAVEPLTRYNLLQPVVSDAGQWIGYRMHGFLQWWTMQKLEQDLSMYWSLHFMALACRLIHHSQFLSFRRQLIPHLRRLRRLFREWYTGRAKYTLERDTNIPLDAVVQGFSEVDQWREAEELGIEVLQVNERLLGPQHPSTLKIMRLLASNFKSQERTYEAEELETWLVEVNKNTYGFTHSETLRSVEDLASTYQMQQRWEEAKTLYTQVLEIKEATLGRDDFYTLMSVRKLASVYVDERRWKEAEELLEYAMIMSNEPLTLSHTRILLMADLANVLQHLGRLEESENMYLRIRELIDKSLLVPVLAQILMDEYIRHGRVSEADKLVSLFVDATINYPRFKNPVNQNFMRHLIPTLARLGCEKDAMDLSIRAMESDRKNLGIENKVTLQSMIAVTWIYNKQGRWNEAEDLCFQVMETSKRIFGTQHPLALESAISLVPQYWHRHQWIMAEQLCNQTINESEHTLGTKHPLTLGFRLYLARNLIYQERWSEAKKTVTEVFQIGNSLFQPKHYLILGSVYLLSMIYMGQERWEEAEFVMKKALHFPKVDINTKQQSSPARASSLDSYQYCPSASIEAADQIGYELTYSEMKDARSKHSIDLTSSYFLVRLHIEQKRPNEAEKLMIQLTTYYNKTLGPRNPDTLEAMSILAWTIFHQGRWREAKSLFKRTIQTEIEALGENHLYTVLSMIRLFSVYVDRGFISLAEDLSLKILDARVNSLGTEHPGTLLIMGFHANIVLFQGRWKEAEELFIDLIEAQHRVSGRDHPDTLKHTHDLANVYAWQERFTESVALSVQVVENKTKALGALHSDTLVTMKLLAQNYAAQARWKDASELFTRVIESEKTLYGAENHHVLSSTNLFVSMLIEQRCLLEAEELTLRVLEIETRTNGTDHRDVPPALSNLSRIRFWQGRWKDAQDAESQEVETKTKALGQEHPATLLRLDDLTRIIRYRGLWKEAEKQATRAVKTKGNIWGLQNPHTMRSVSDLAHIYHLLGKWKQARGLYDDVETPLANIIGTSHSLVLLTKTRSASLWNDQGQWKRAEELGVVLVKTAREILPVGHQISLDAMAVLSSTYRRLGRWNESETLGVEVMETWSRTIGPEHPFALASACEIVKIYIDRGREKDVIKLAVETRHSVLRILGEEHPLYTEITMNLATIYGAQGSWHEATELGEEAVDKGSRGLGAEHPKVIEYMDDLASIHFGIGQLGKAEELCAQAMKVRINLLGIEHPDSLASMHNYARMRKSQDRDWEAIALLDQVVRSRREQFGPEHYLTVLATEELHELRNCSKRLTMWHS